MSKEFWSKQEDADLHKYYGQGLTYAQIGALMGRSRSGCQQRAYNIGLRRGVRNQHMPIRHDREVYEGELPTLPFVPGIVVTGRYHMRAR